MLISVRLHKISQRRTFSFFDKSYLRECWIRNLVFDCQPVLPHSPPTHLPHSDQLDQGNQDPIIHSDSNIHVSIVSTTLPNLTLGIS